MQGLTLIAFLSMLGMGLVWSIWAALIDSYTHSPALTGVVVALLIGVSTSYPLLLTPFLSQVEHKRLFLLGLGIMGTGCVLFATTRHLAAFLLVALFYLLGYMIHHLTLSIITRDASTKSTISKHEGVKFLFMKLGQLIAPLLIMLLFTGKNFSTILIFAALILFVGLWMAHTALPRFRQKTRPSIPVRENLQAYFRSPLRTLTFCMAAGVRLFWGFAYTYLPLYILYSHLPPSFVGLALLGVTLPPVLLDYAVGNFAPRFGFRQTFLAGFGALALFMLCAWVSQNPMIVLLLVSFAAIGIAFLEPSIEAYFFRITTQEEQQRYLGVYLTADRVGLISGKLLGAAALLFTSLHGLIGIYGLAFAAFLLVARRV